MDEIAHEDTDSIVTLFSRAVADAREVARAEIEFQTARVLAKVDEARNAVVFLVAALVMGSMALTALVVGALLILAQRIGPGWATVIVAGVLVCGSAVLGWLSLRQFKLMFGKRDKPKGSMR